MYIYGCTVKYIIEQLDILVMDEQKLRRIIRQVIKEQTDPALLQEKSQLYATFVDPFVDIAKAATLTTKDTLNSLSLAWDTFFTLSPKKLKLAKEKYKKRKDSIKKEWDPIMKSTEDALRNSDFGALLFVTNPHLYLGAKLGEEITDVPGKVTSALSQAGWTVPLAKLIPGFNPESDAAKGMKAGDDKGKKDSDRGIVSRVGSIIGDIAGLFYIESVDPNLPLLVEQSGQSRQTLQAIRGWLDDTGAAAGFEAAAKELAQGKLEQAEELVADVRERAGALRNLAAAENFDQFLQALTAAQAAGIEGVDEIEGHVKKMHDDLAAEKERLVADQEFRKKAAAEAKKELSDDEVQKAAEGAAKQASSQTFEQLKQQVVDGMRGSQEKLQDQLKAELFEDLPEEGTDEYKILASSPVGKQMLDALEKAIASVAVVGGTGE